MCALRASRRLPEAHALDTERPRRRTPPLYAGGIPARARGAPRELRQASGRRNLGAAARGSLGMASGEFMDNGPDPARLRPSSPCRHAWKFAMVLPMPLVTRR